MKLTKFKHIVISEEHYDELKELGRAGDSFNDVIGMILQERCNDD